MYLPFEKLPGSSKIWIYQADRTLQAGEVEFATGFLTTYCDQWAAHGQPLKASFQILENQFVVLAVDESHNGTSGCSVDDSVHAIQHIGSVTGADFFNRELIAFKNTHVFLLPLKGLKKGFEDGLWNESTISFNNLVSTKEQFETSWMIPAVQTWLARYIPAQSVKT